MSSKNGISEDTSIYSKVAQNDDYEKNKKLKIDNIKQRYPYCIVWTPLPCISWFIPSIGHVGICNSQGIIHDFAGPHYVFVDDMAFGNPTKFVILELSQKEINEYDKAVELGKQYYNKLNYNFCTNNCYSFVANVLNRLKYKGRNDYNMVDVWWIFTTKSKYITWGDLFKTYSGFIFIMIIFFIFYYILKNNKF